MLVKRENKGSGGIADIIEEVNIDSCCWYQGMKFFSPFSQKAIPRPDGVCWVTACSSAGRVGHWYPGIGWTYPQLLPLMQIQQGLIRLSREAVWFASVYASFRERLIAIQGDMIRNRKNIIWCIFTYLRESWWGSAWTRVWDLQQVHRNSCPLILESQSPSSPPVGHRVLF